MRHLLALALCLASPAQGGQRAVATPDGNIHCAVDTQSERLDVVCILVDWQEGLQRPRPLTCNGGWGHVFALRETGQPRMRCGAPVAAPPGADPLVPGFAARFGAIACELAGAALTCRNGDGRGFTLSRDRQVLF